MTEKNDRASLDTLGFALLKLIGERRDSERFRCINCSATCSAAPAVQFCLHRPVQNDSCSAPVQRGRERCAYSCSASLHTPRATRWFMPSRLRQATEYTRRSCHR